MVFLGDRIDVGSCKGCYWYDPQHVALIADPFDPRYNRSVLTSEAEQLQKLVDAGIPTVKFRLETVQLKAFSWKEEVHRTVECLALVEEKWPNHTIGSWGSVQKPTRQTLESLERLANKMHEQQLSADDFQFLWNDQEVVVCDPGFVMRSGEGADHLYANLQHLLKHGNQLIVTKERACSNARP